MPEDYMKSFIWAYDTVENNLEILNFEKYLNGEPMENCCTWNAQNKMLSGVLTFVGKNFPWKISWKKCKVSKDITRTVSMLLGGTGMNGL